LSEWLAGWIASLPAILHSFRMSDQVRDEPARSAAETAEDAASGRQPGLVQRLAANCVRAISEEGLEGLTLRSVAAASDVSTTAIVHHLKNKAGLIEAAQRYALEADEAFHRGYLRGLPDFKFDHMAFSDIVSSYIETRTETGVARFWSEILFKASQLPSDTDAIGLWHAMRVRFWSQLLERAGRPASFAEHLAAYVVMEEAYAYALVGDLEYRALLRETVRAATSRCFGVGTASRDATEVEAWIARRHRSLRIDPIIRAQTLPERLLDVAVTHALEHGVGTLNQRDVTKTVGTSSSMIVYHFGDMDRFMCDVIWRAFRQDLPAEYDPNMQSIDRTDTIDEWARMVASLIKPRDGDAPPGFYMGISRIAGQASLLVRRHENLRPQINQLRSIEGFGTHRASQKFWPKSTNFDLRHATAFGIWIKGQAILNAAREPRRSDHSSSVLAAGAHFDGLR
jgi:AcrR family transcriptional regulator